MRVAILSDIHGNAIALESVLRDIEARGGVDAYWILGDLAAIGHDPIGVLERLAQLANATLVRGNTDRYLVTGERPGPTAPACQADPALWPVRVEVAGSFGWTQGIVTVAGWAEWLAGLPLERRFVLPDGTRALCVHASPGRDDGQGVHPGVGRGALGELVAGCQADLVLTGHTHWPMDVQIDGTRLVNAGSVSNGFPPDLRASYVLLEAHGAGYRLRHRRVAYDREAVIAALHAVNHPAVGYISHHMRGENRPHWR